MSIISTDLSEMHFLMLASKVGDMHNRGVFDFENLRRKISQHCRTTSSHSGKWFGIGLKNKHGGLGAHIIDTVDGITEIHVICNRFYPKYDFTFHVADNKEFMEKILLHNLL